MSKQVACTLYEIMH